MYDQLIKRLRDAAKMSDALSVLLPHIEGNAVAQLYREAADVIEELTITNKAIQISGGGGGGNGDTYGGGGGGGYGGNDRAGGAKVMKPRLL